ncbi:sensor histidine kinase [Calditrichota bacterium GD2]
MTNFLKNYSLRTKLVLLYSVLLISSAVLISYFSYWDIWQILISNKASQLRAVAKPIIEYWLIEQGLNKSDSNNIDINLKNARRLAYDLTSRNVVAVIIDRSGKVLANGKRLPEEPVAPDINVQYFKKALSGMNEINYLDSVNGKDILVFLIPIRPQPGDQDILGVIQMSTTLSDVNKILLRHGSRLFTAVAMVLVLGIFFGYWLIGGNLKDLQKLSTACQEIAKGNFTERASLKGRKDEIGKLANSFNLMIDKIEKLFNSQKRFVANAAHELLTPLTGLRGSLEVLLRGAQDDPEAVNRLSKGMYSEVNHLIRLCDRLLGLSRLENALNVSKKRIFLNEFMDEFEQKAKQLFPDNSIVIQKGPYVSLLADPDLLEQILHNLLSNAVSYSSPTLPIAIGWKLIPGFVQIWVADQGEGMDKETLSHAFEPFYRGKNQKLRGIKGSGLGLALTRAMVEAHAGLIRIKSTHGKGTIVFFTLPL